MSALINLLAIRRKTILLPSLMRIFCHERKGRKRRGGGGEEEEDVHAGESEAGGG